MERRELSLSEIQQESLKVLLRFDEICGQNGWHYFLAYGTLLGAVRHGGFIPWDDDVDVMMPRKDFDQFVRYALDNEASLKPLKLHNRANTPNYSYGIPRFSNMEYRYIIDNDYEESFDIGVFIDIYPVDNHGNSREEAEQIFKKCLDMHRQYIWYINKRSPGVLRNAAKFLIHHYMVLRRGRHYSQTADAEVLAYIQSHTSDQDKYVGVPAWEPAMVLYERALVKDWETEKHSFEGHMLNIPQAYDYILQCSYGDYRQLPPERDRHPTHSYKVVPRVGKE